MLQLILRNHIFAINHTQTGYKRPDPDSGYVSPGYIFPNPSIKLSNTGAKWRAILSRASAKISPVNRSLTPTVETALQRLTFIKSVATVSRRNQRDRRECASGCIQNRNKRKRPFRSDRQDKFVVAQVKCARPCMSFFFLVGLNVWYMTFPTFLIFVESVKFRVLMVFFTQDFVMKLNTHIFRGKYISVPTTVLKHISEIGLFQLACKMLSNLEGKNPSKFSYYVPVVVNHINQRTFDTIKVFYIKFCPISGPVTLWVLYLFL